MSGRKMYSAVIFSTALLAMAATAMAGETGGIQGITALATVEVDGAKAYAIAVEYGTDLTGAQVSADTFEVWNYAMDLADSCELGSNPAAVTAVYVNDEAEVSGEGGSGSGNYVIIELNTDYQLARANAYYLSMASGVKQVADITADAGVIAASDEETVNYEEYTYVDRKPTGEEEEKTEYRAVSGGYQIKEVDRYTIDVFHAADCFEEATGETVDVDLDYALFVPEDYDEANKYMMVLQIEDAGALSNDAMVALTEAKTPVALISDDIQNYAKELGYGGVIVLVPQITEELRSTRDNYTVSAAVQATWQLVDSVVEEYNIDTDRIFGTGQSMGGMQVVEMAAQRDNFFAALMPVGCQWGNNYNKEVEYRGSAYYPTPVDDVYVWSKDADGNDCDYQNWYYMVSDDNILCVNCADDSFSTTVWKEFALLYSDLTGVEIPYANWNPLETDVETQNANLEALTASENETGIYWAAFEGGNHMATWVYADKVDAIYYWLLSQTRESEMERGKIACLANDFEYADEQLTTEDRVIAEEDGVTAYFVTGKEGAGTAGYNSGQYDMNGGMPQRSPGWTPESITAD